MRRTLAVAVVGLALAATAATAHAEARPRYGGNLEVTLLGAPATLDPVAGHTHAEATVASLVFDTLYRIGPDGVVLPHLAAGEPTLDDKRTTVFVPLRKGVQMHDGGELTATDVAQSLERTRRQARWVLPAVLAVKPDPDGIVLSLRAPVAELTALLALPQTAITRAGAAPGERPIGSGPFVVGGFDRTRRKLQLRAFDAHFAGRPYVDSLALVWYDTPDGEAREFETGRAHVSARGATAFAGTRPAVKVAHADGPPAVLLFVGFGRAHRDITGDSGFRRALDLAIARNGVVGIARGERVVPTRSPLPVEAGGAALPAAARASNMNAARLALAGAQRRVTALAPANLPRLRLEILVDNTRPDDRELAERVALALDKLGIGAVITALPAHQLRDRVRRGACDLYIDQLALPTTTPAVWWASAFAAGGSDWAIARLHAGSLDSAVAAKEHAARLPIVPLAFRSVRMWHATNLRGLAFDVAARPSYADLHVFGAPVKARP